MVQFLVKSNSVRHTASRHLANQNVWPTTKNASKMSLIAENKEEARSIWGIIKIYVHAVAMQQRILQTTSFFTKKKKNQQTKNYELLFLHYFCCKSTYLNYSRVHKSSDSFFSKILEKLSIVQKKMIPQVDLFLFVFLRKLTTSKKRFEIN